PLDLGARPDRLDPAIADKHRAVADDGEISHLRAAAHACRSRECDQLTAVGDNHIGRLMLCSRANSMAFSYPASACRITPVPGSVVRTRSSRRSISGVPSATTTIPAC